MSVQPIKEFRGYAIKDTSKWTDFEVIAFEPKRFEEYDIEIAITHCGVCASDVHTITGGWGEPILPLITGHEIVGTATRVGDRVTTVKVGDRVGVGAQVGSCLKCNPCKTDNENYCPDMVDTYNAKYSNGDIAHGGYSNGVRAHEQYVFPIPEKLKSEECCVLLCAGLTVYSPLKRHGGLKKDGKTAIVGLGGLGHLAVMFASAAGAEVTVFTHSKDKKGDALKFGATKVVDVGDQKFSEPFAHYFDCIVSTRDDAKDYDIATYVAMLGVHGRFVLAGLPDDPLEPFKAQALSGNGAMIVGSHIGSKVEALEMLDFAAKHDIKAAVELYEMKDAGKAVKACYDNKSRYRGVLRMDL